MFRPYDLVRDQRLFAELKLRAVSLAASGQFDDWEWLAFAQHIGVPTRLLSWSVNPLVALYFALKPDAKSDRVVYAGQYAKHVHEVARTHEPVGCGTGRYPACLA